MLVVTYQPRSMQSPRSTLALPFQNSEVVASAVIFAQALLFVTRTHQCTIGDNVKYLPGHYKMSPSPPICFHCASYTSARNTCRHCHPCQSRPSGIFFFFFCGPVSYGTTGHNQLHESPSYGQFGLLSLGAPPGEMLYALHQVTVWDSAHPTPTGAWW
jgi:hypothetical protein